MNTTSKLLIVDDEPGLTKILSLLLKDDVNEIQIAKNGKEALALIRAGDFDAVLSDINMPEMNGLDLLANVRQMNMEIPFVFLTGYADFENTREALRLGATDFIQKPFNPESIIEVMKKVIELGQLQKMIEAETESLYNKSDIPSDTKLKLRKMKQSILLMKLSSSIYKK